MRVIDVDTHFEIAIDPEDHPFSRFRDEVPTSVEVLASGVAGDLLAHTPVEDAPPIAVLGAMLSPPENESSARFATFEGESEPRFRSLDVDERLRWMDSVGIDFALVNPGAIGMMACGFLDQYRAELLRRANDFMADYVAGHTDRLAPVTLADWRDLAGGIAELRRMRAKGSRAFWVRAEAYGGVSPAHPDWDRVWSAATDLGMLAILHVGNTPPAFGSGWANAGWNRSTGAGVGGFVRYANALRHQAAEMMLGGMVYGGVFARHPGLTVVTEELGVGWLPYFVDRCRSLTAAGPWPYERSPEQMVRDQVRSAPLPGLGDPCPFVGALAGLGEMLVFSSDYPHGEGSADPVALFEPGLSELSETERARFLGKNIADCFSRMGDPL